MWQISQEGRCHVSARKTEEQRWACSERAQGFDSKRVCYAQSLLGLGAAWGPVVGLVERPQSGQAVMIVQYI